MAASPTVAGQQQQQQQASWDISTEEMVTEPSLTLLEDVGIDLQTLVGSGAAAGATEGAAAPAVDALAQEWRQHVAAESGDEDHGTRQRTPNATRTLRGPAPGEDLEAKTASLPPWVVLDPAAVVSETSAPVEGTTGMPAAVVGHSVMPGAPAPPADVPPSRPSSAGSSQRPSTAAASGPRPSSAPGRREEAPGGSGRGATPAPPAGKKPSGGRRGGRPAPQGPHGDLLKPGAFVPLGTRSSSTGAVRAATDAAAVRAKAACPRRAAPSPPRAHQGAPSSPPDSPTRTWSAAGLEATLPSAAVAAAAAAASAAVAAEAGQADDGGPRSNTAPAAAAATAGRRVSDISNWPELPRLIRHLERHHADEMGKLQVELMACRRDVSQLRTELQVLRAATPAAAAAPAAPHPAPGSKTATPHWPSAVAGGGLRKATPPQQHDVQDVREEFRIFRLRAEKTDRELKEAVGRLQLESRRCAEALMLGEAGPEVPLAQSKAEPLPTLGGSAAEEEKPAAEAFTSPVALWGRLEQTRRAALWAKSGTEESHTALHALVRTVRVLADRLGLGPFGLGACGGATLAETAEALEKGVATTAKRRRKVPAYGH